MKTGKKILVAFILNLAFAVFELVGGLWTGSVAILSDALHDSMYAYSVEHTGAERLWREKRITAEFRGLACGFPMAEGLRIIKYPDGGNDFHLRTLLAGKFRWAGTKMYYPQTGLEW